MEVLPFYHQNYIFLNQKNNLIYILLDILCLINYLIQKQQIITSIYSIRSSQNEQILQKYSILILFNLLIQISQIIEDLLRTYIRPEQKLKSPQEGKDDKKNFTVKKTMDIRKKSLSNQTKESFKGIFESIPSRNLIQFKSYHSQAFNQKQEQSQIYHLTDFRIAKIWKPQNRHETSGTQGYMAPEVICRQNLMEFLQISLLQELFCMNLGKRPYNPSWKCILCSQYLVCMLIDSNCQQVITLPAQGTIRSFIFTFSLLFCLLNCFTFFAQIDNLALRFYRAGILGVISI